MDKKIKKVLELRLALSRSGVSKYQAILRAGVDGVLRYAVQFNGASRTGRAAGRLFQPHNLFKSKIKTLAELEQAILDIKSGAIVDRADAMTFISSCIRSVLVARPGHNLIVADWSNIEGRISAWLAKEEWKVKAFNEFDNGTGKDLYIVNYAKAFNVPIAQVDDECRFIGKCLELSCQYGGWIGAFRRSAKKRSEDFTDDQIKEFILAWRKLNKNIVNIWEKLMRACIAALTTGKTYSYNAGQLKIKVIGEFLTIQLPNGRKLCYYKPKIENIIHFGKPKTVFSYIGKKPLSGKWARIKTHPGMLFENIVQGICACIMKETIARVYHSNECREGLCMPILQVHDEPIIEAAEGIPLSFLIDKMVGLSEVYKGLPVAAKGFITKAYRKEA